MSIRRKPHAPQDLSEERVFEVSLVTFGTEVEPEAATVILGRLALVGRSLLTERIVEGRQMVLFELIAALGHGVIDRVHFYLHDVTRIIFNVELFSA
jgi:hypothetical protein